MANSKINNRIEIDPKNEIYNLDPAEKSGLVQLSVLNALLRNFSKQSFTNKKHAFFGSILTRPLVKEIGYHSKVPIMVMHDLRN